MNKTSESQNSQRNNFLFYKYCNASENWKVLKYNKIPS